MKLLKRQQKQNIDLLSQFGPMIFDIKNIVSLGEALPKRNTDWITQFGPMIFDIIIIVLLGEAIKTNYRLDFSVWRKCLCH